MQENSELGNRLFFACVTACRRASRGLGKDGAGKSAQGGRKAISIATGNSARQFVTGHKGDRIPLMGILSDVFIAGPHELTDEVFNEGPIGRLPSVEGKGLFPTSVAKLWRVLDPEAAEPFAKHWIIENAGTNPECEIYRIPAPIVAGIAQASNERLREIEIAWIYDGTAPPADLLKGITNWFEEFVDLLKEADAQKLGAYVWMST
jgi:hypothetical protein